MQTKLLEITMNNSNSISTLIKEVSTLQFNFAENVNNSLNLLDSLIFSVFDNSENKITAQDSEKLRQCLTLISMTKQNIDIEALENLIEYLNQPTYNPIALNPTHSINQSNK